MRCRSGAIGPTPASAPPARPRPRPPARERTGKRDVILGLPGLGAPSENAPFAGFHRREDRQQQEETAMKMNTPLRAILRAASLSVATGLAVARSTSMVELGRQSAVTADAKPMTVETMRK